ncbi:hypothetical protein B9T25_08465 [Acinetobacter sp. ANC 4470]|nr:hypothetical protein B9T25_08465 [Acinetobacter sp. ANC 4470]
MLKAKIKTTAQSAKVQLIGLILFVHLLPVLYIHLYFIIIQPNAAVWIGFIAYFTLPHCAIIFISTDCLQHFFA